MTEKQMIAAAGNESKQKIMRAFLDYVKAYYKYKAMLNSYEKCGEVCTPLITVTFPDDQGE